MARSRYEGEQARVYEVIDGDTVTVILTRTERFITVRLVGIDTPETLKPGVPVECGGPEATEFMKSIGFRADGVGKVVDIDTDESQDLKDRYGRLLAYLDTDTGDLGGQSVAAGWATPYVYGGKEFQRFDGYSAAESLAASAMRGVNGECGGDFHSES